MNNLKQIINNHKERKEHKQEQASMAGVRFSLRSMCSLWLILCCLGCPIAYSAASSNLREIVGNMGGIGLDGLPRLSFEIVDRQDAGELAALGFGFKLAHRTGLGVGRTARTEWLIPCLQTCAYVEAGGDLLWLSPLGAIMRFQKNGDDYVSNTDLATAKILQKDGTIEITMRTLIKWRYRNGFLESVVNRGGNYSVKTDRGTILSISKMILNREIPLLKCAYSKQGDLEEMEFAEGRKYILQWSANHSLMSIDGPEGRRFAFEYADSLLTCWTKANGPRNELKWQYYLDNVRTTAFQTPPVLLREDASHVYRWDKDNSASVDTVKIYDRSGNLLSETQIGAAGVMQTTPNGEIIHSFKKNP